MRVLLPVGLWYPPIPKSKVLGHKYDGEWNTQNSAPAQVPITHRLWNWIDHSLDQKLHLQFSELNGFYYYRWYYFQNLNLNHHQRNPIKNILLNCQKFQNYWPKLTFLLSKAGARRIAKQCGRQANYQLMSLYQEHVHR